MPVLDALTAKLEGSLIEASAGTGKTYTLTTLFLRLLIERGLSISEILVVTFTKAATAELRERLRGRLVEALAAFDGAAADPALATLVARSADRARDRGRVLAALRAFDEAAIYTIHGLCQRVLARHAVESGSRFEIELAPDEGALLAEVVADFWARSLYDASPAWVRHVLEVGTTPEELIALAEAAVADPEMPVLPPAPSAAALEASLAAFDEARVAAAAIWRAERARVVSLLETAPLKRTTYRKDYIASWIAPMDRALLDARPAALVLFDRFGRFTNAELAAATSKGAAAPRHPFFDACDRLEAAFLAARREAESRMLAWKRDLVAYARSEAPRRKEAAGVQSFDDLLRRLDVALSGEGGPALAEGLRAQYKAALIDEFQDTDPVQYRIFQRIYAGPSASSLFLIGDPKQAIYSFRGADVFAYLRAAGEAGRRYTLETNYRSDPGVVAAVNALFARSASPFVLGDIAFTAVRPAPDASPKLRNQGEPEAPFRFLFVKREGGGEAKPLAKRWADEHVPAAIAADIARRLGGAETIGGRPLRAGDIAVLVRKNRQAAAMQRALRALHVPSVLQGDESVFDAPEAEELERVIAAMLAPSSAAAVRAALVTSLFDLPADEILAIERDDEAWDAWTSRFAGWGARLLERGFIAAFRRLLDDQEAPARLLRQEGGERRLTNFLHLAELLQVAARREHLGPAGLQRWLSAMRSDVRARDPLGAEAAELRLESDAAAVKLVTIHKSKGLEYPIVYCPYLWDGKLGSRDAGPLVFHDPEDANRQKLHLSATKDDAHAAHAAREAFAENLRLLYVALTRGKHQVSVVWGNFQDAATSALAYLLHAPAPAPQGGAAVDLPALKKLVEGLDDGAMRAVLRDLAAASGGAILAEDLDLSPGAPYTFAMTAPEALRCRALTRGTESSFRTSSFSALVASASAGAPVEIEGRDRDAEDAGPPPAPAVATPAAEAPVLLHDFPRGAQAGDLLHKVFERVDFDASEEAIAARAEEELRRVGLPVEPLRDVVARAAREVLATPLPAPAGPRFALRDIPRGRRLTELEFLFPVAPHKGGTVAPLVTSRSVAEVLARHAGGKLSPAYIESLRRLAFAPFEGFLRGFIDLVVEHEGRFYVIDYKSNFLGPLPGDYSAPAIYAAMAEHHYFLQYHLYTVAVHRYLARRLPRYDYDRAFGGVFYLFIRGMARDRGAEAVYVDRPERALIEALSSLFDGARGGRGRRAR